MEYDEWIDREWRIRIKILMGSVVNWEKQMFRICQDCGEICLCHEQTCPNCDSNNIVQEKVDDIGTELLSGGRIRCRFRFEHLP